MKSCYIARSPMVAARELGGEIVIMSAVNSSLFTLNDVASLIWKSADGATPLEEIVEKIVCAEFDVNAATALIDAQRLVDELVSHGILLAKDHPIERFLPSVGSKP